MTEVVLQEQMQKSDILNLRFKNSQSFTVKSLISSHEINEFNINSWQTYEQNKLRKESKKEIEKYYVVSVFKYIVIT